jgi:hypothetical protein
MSNTGATPQAHSSAVISNIQSLQKGKVLVWAPDGLLGFLPAAEFDSDAIAQGYRQASPEDARAHLPDGVIPDDLAQLPLRDTLSLKDGLLIGGVGGDNRTDFSNMLSPAGVLVGMPAKHVSFALRLGYRFKTPADHVEHLTWLAHYRDLKPSHFAKLCTHGIGTPAGPITNALGRAVADTVTVCSGVRCEKVEYNLGTGIGPKARFYLLEFELSFNGSWFLARCWRADGFDDWTRFPSRPGR